MPARVGRDRRRRQIVAGRRAARLRGGSGWSIGSASSPSATLTRQPFGELTLRGTAPHLPDWFWPGPRAYDTSNPVERARLRFAYTVPGVFAQDDVDLRHVCCRISAARASIAHSEYGTFLSPRVSGPLQGDDWSSRRVIGSGFLSPRRAVVEKTEPAGLSAPHAACAVSRRSARKRSSSMFFSVVGCGLRATVRVFASRSAPRLDVQPYGIALVNLILRPTTNAGPRFVSSWRAARFSVVAAYCVRVRAARGRRRCGLWTRAYRRHRLAWYGRRRGAIGVE